MTEALRKYEDVIRPLMGTKRFKHSCNVAEMALTLAKKFGEDEDKTYTAAILHDCRKEAPRDIMREEVLKSGFFVDPVELENNKLWHGIAGAYYVRNTLKIEDTDILNAIRFHTVGRAHMSKLEKIIYLADLVSAERDFEDVEKYRAFVLGDLDNGMYQALRWSIGKTVESENKVPVSTLQAFNYYLDRKK